MNGMIRLVLWDCRAEDPRGRIGHSGGGGGFGGWENAGAVDTVRGAAHVSERLGERITMRWNESMSLDCCLSGAGKYVDEHGRYNNMFMFMFMNMFSVTSRSLF